MILSESKDNWLINVLKKFGGGVISRSGDIKLQILVFFRIFNIMGIGEARKKGQLWPYITQNGHTILKFLLLIIIVYIFFYKILKI